MRVVRIAVDNVVAVNSYACVPVRKPSRATKHNLPTSKPHLCLSTNNKSQGARSFDVFCSAFCTLFRKMSQTNTEQTNTESPKEPFIPAEEVPVLEKCSNIEVHPTIALIASIVCGFTIGCLVGYVGIMLCL